MIEIVCLVMLAWCAAFYWGFNWFNQKKRKEAEARRREAARKRHLEGAKGGFVANPGLAWNPLQSYPRNLPCFCDSGKKAKVCCLPTLKRTCAARHVDQLKDLMKQQIARHTGQNVKITPGGVEYQEMQ